MPRRTDEDITMRHKIVDAFDRLLETYSVEDITIRMLCNEANISTGTFYHYFQSKDSLLVFRHHEGSEHHAALMRAAVQGKPTEEQLYTFTQLYAEMNMEAGLQELRSVQFAGNRFYMQRHPIVNVLEDIIREGQERGTIISSISYTEITDLFMETLRGCVFCWGSADGAYDLAARLHKHVRILIHALIRLL